MAVILLLLFCGWAVFRTLLKDAGLLEQSLNLLVICFLAFYLSFDQAFYFTRYVVLLTAIMLAALIMIGLTRPAEGKPWGYAALLGTSVLVYFGLVSSYVPTWRGQVANIDTPLWNGTFYVVQGGNNVLLNGHSHPSGVPAQRHALDIVKLSQFGSSATRLFPGEALTQYAVYNEPVFAPCDGIVLVAESGFEDLPAGASDPDNPAGNYVAIGCDEGFTVVLAHLQRGSFGSPGERVRAEGYIGRVGNSGNTTQPHLHIHAVAGLVKDEKEALFTGKGIPLTINHTVLFKNSTLQVHGCPPIPGIDLLSGLNPA